MKDVVTELSRRKVLDPYIYRICVESPAIFSNNDINTAEEFYRGLLLDRSREHLENLRLCKLLVTASILDARQSSTPLKLRMGVGSASSRDTSEFAETVLECCRILLDLGRKSAVKQLLMHCARFLHLFKKASDTLAEDIFDFSLALQDLPESVKLLRTMDMTTSVFKSSLHKLALRCKETGSNSLLVYLHDTYSGRYEHDFAESLQAALYSAYAEVSERKAALFLLRSAKKLTDESMLSATQPTWAAMIKTVWRETKNSAFTIGMFENMYRLAGESNVDVALYNAIILVSIESGKVEEAKRFLRQMQHRDKLRPDLTTFGHFILAAAMAQNWLAVHSLLDMLGSSDDIHTSPADRTRLFNPVLREFIRHHEPTDIWNFATKVADVNGIIFDQATCNMVLESFVHGKRLDLVKPWLSYLHTCGFACEILPFTAMRMIRRYYFDMRPSHVNLMWFCRNITTSSPRLHSHDLTLLVREAIGYYLRNQRRRNQSRRFEAAVLRHEMLRYAQDLIPTPMAWSSLPAMYARVGQPSFVIEDAGSAFPSRSSPELDSHVSNTQALLLERQPPPIQEPSVTTDKHLSVLFEPESMIKPLPSSESGGAIPYSRVSVGSVPSDKRQTEVDVLLSLSLGQPADAVEFYKRSLAASGLPYSSISLETAITASIRAQRGDPAEAEELLQSAQEAGLNTASALLPLFMQRITSARDRGETLDPAKLTNVIMGFYRTMNENGIPIRHHLATTAAYCLFKTGQAHQAITLLRGIYDAEWNKSQLNLAAMTVLLQSYIKIRHANGINWTVGNVLDKNMHVDAAFVRVLKYGNNHLRYAFTATGKTEFQDLIPVVRHWIDLCEQRRKEQIREANRFGNMLVRTIVKCVRQEPVVDVSHRQEIEAQILGRSRDPRYLAVRQHYGLMTPSQQKGLKLSGMQRVRAYRAFTRRGLSENGRRLKFRYVEKTLERRPIGIGRLRIYRDRALHWGVVSGTS